MWVLYRDQHVSARTCVCLAAEGALLIARTCALFHCRRCTAAKKNDVHMTYVHFFFAHVLMCAQFIHSALEDKGGEVQLVSESICA